MIDTTEKTFGAVDVLVNNAGIQFVAKVEDFPIEKWDAVIAINLSAAFHTTRVAIPGMKTRKWGRIINIASAHGLVASGEKVAYVAAKHGIVGLTKVVAIEAANDGITCNAICPGWVLTPLVQQQIEARAKAQGKTVEQAKNELVAEKQPMLQVHHAGEHRRARSVPRRRCSRDDHRLVLLDRRRLDRAVARVGLSCFPSLRLRGEGAEHRRPEAGEGPRRNSQVPLTRLAIARHPLPVSRGEGKKSAARVKEDAQ